MINYLKATWKKSLSFFKSNWGLDDYPLRYKNQADHTEHYNIGELKPWTVQIINWWSMTGLGETKEDAYKMLKDNFESYRQNDELPRPGTIVPLKYADSSEIERLDDVAPDFFEKIININYYDCFISDQSSLTDFGLDDNETLDKINSTYDLELRELGDGNIVRLLRLVRDKKGSR